MIVTREVHYGKMWCS